MRNLSRLVFVVIFILSASLFADSIIRFKGNTSNWSDNSGWWNGKENRLPCVDDNVVIPGEKSVEKHLVIKKGVTAAAKTIKLGSKKGYKLIIAGGRLEIAEDFNLSQGKNHRATVDVKNGQLIIGQHFHVGYTGKASVNVSGGEILVDGWLVVGQADQSKAKLTINGGKVSCQAIGIGKQGIINIAGGVLQWKDYDKATELNQLIKDSKIIAYGGDPAYEVQVKWDGHNTTVSARLTPELNVKVNADGVNVITPRLEGKPKKEGKPVGFVIHPMHKAFEEKLANLPVNAELSNVFLWRMKDQEKEIVDTNSYIEWLTGIYATGRQAYPILDTSVYHSSAHWRSAKTTKAGEYMVGADGNIWQFKYPDGSVTSWASLYSPMFRESVLNYVDQLVDWVKVNDWDGRIPGYINGAEWFMPATVDYSPLGIKEFQGWLKDKYTSLKVVNSSWGAKFSDWSQVDPPRGTLLGYDYTGLRTVGFDTKSIEARWSSQPVAVEPDKDYKVSIKLRNFDVPTGLCVLKLACYDNRGNLIKYKLDGQLYWSNAKDGQWDQIAEICRTPAGTVTAKLQMITFAPGKADFVNPSLKDLAGNELLPQGSNDFANAKKMWTFETENNIGSGKVAKDQYDSKKSRFVITVPKLKMPYKNTSVAWDDWITFCYEKMAEWLDICAQHIKEKDPSREIVSYIGAASSTHYLGDFNMYWQRLDISLANSPNVGVNGIQLSFAGNDVTCTTCPIDIARKYGKDIYATDMVDFPYGLYSGFTTAYRAILAGVQHGMDGSFCYSWFDPIVPSYDHSSLTADQLEKYVGNVKASIELLQDYELKTGVGFLLPVMPYSLADDGGYKSDWIDMAGSYHLILDSGITPDVFTPYELEKYGYDLIKDYKMIYLPDCPVLGDKANSLLYKYVSNGGCIIGAGRPPRKNIAGKKFADNLTGQVDLVENPVAALQSPQGNPIGKGKVFWLSNMLGQSYMGPARRWTSAGNTPPPFMPLDNSIERNSIKREIRNQLQKLMSTANIQSKASLAASEDVIHLACYDNDSKQILFLLNQAQGRSRGVKLQSEHAAKGTRIEAWIDFDKKVDLVVNKQGLVDVPEFFDSCIVTFDYSVKVAK